MHIIRSRLKKTIAIAIGFFMFTIIPANANLQGIDVSSWQPANITRIVNADFAIVKATQGTTYVNPYWESQITGALDTGKLIGLYHYASGGTAIDEADFFLETVSEYIGEAVLILDWESNQNSQWGNGGWVEVFVKRIHAKTGVWPLVYVQASAISQIPSTVWDNCGLWVAQYANNNTTGFQNSPWNIGIYGEAMRQYTSHGRLDGYSGNLDLDLFLGDEIAWMKYAQGDNYNSSSSSSSGSSNNGQTSSTTNICVTIRSGDTLSSIAAKYGTNYTQWSGYSSGNPNLIYPGEIVCVTTNSTNVSISRSYIVRSGDTLSGIAAKLGLSSWTQLTGYSSGNPNLIYPGETLYY